MKPDDLKLDDELTKLWEQMISLHSKMRDYTSEKYQRINPFLENLFEWRDKGTFVGGNNVTIYDSSTVVGDVKIGDNTWIGPFCSIDGTGGLTIGEHCSVSAGTHIQSHDSVCWALSRGKQKYEYKPVSIGDCCFLGVNVVIIAGVTIGKHCLIGAGAVVTQDIPDFSIALGVPARIVGQVVLEEDAVKLCFNHNQ